MRKATGKRNLSLIKNILFSFLAIVLFFLLLEGFMRLLPLKRFYKIESGMDLSGWAAGPYARYDPLLKYRLIPNLARDEYRLNSFGYRGGEFSKEKPENTFRIICIGGSTTIGSNAGGNDFTYPYLLEEIFSKTVKQRGKRVEVINAGVFGYHSWHHLLQIEAELNSFNPDLYLIMGGLNDVMASVESSVKRGMALELRNHEILASLVKTKKQPILYSLDRYMFRLEFYRFFRMAASRIKDRYRDSMITGYKDLTGLDEQTLSQRLEVFKFEDNMDKIIQRAKEKSIEIVLVNYPWIVRGNASQEEELRRIPYRIEKPTIFYYQFGRKAIASINSKLARKWDIPFVDLQPLFDAETSKENRISNAYSDTIHFTRHGNYLIAREVYRNIAAIKGIREFMGINSVLNSNEIDQLFKEISNWNAN